MPKPNQAASEKQTLMESETLKWFQKGVQLQPGQSGVPVPPFQMFHPANVEFWVLSWLEEQLTDVTIHLLFWDLVEKDQFSDQ